MEGAGWRTSEGDLRVGTNDGGLPAAEAAWVSDLSSYTPMLGLSPPWGAKQMAEEKETLVIFKGK